MFTTLTAKENFPIDPFVLQTSGSHSKKLFCQATAVTKEEESYNLTFSCSIKTNKDFKQLAPFQGSSPKVEDH